MSHLIIKMFLVFGLILAAWPASAVVTTFTGAVNQDFETAGNWDMGVPGPSDTAILNSGTCNLAGTISVLNFTQNGGSFTGTGTLTVTGAYTWTNGIIAGGGITNVPNSATLSVSSANNKSFQNRTLNLAGNGTWTGTGQLNGDSNAGVFNIQSGGVFDIQTDAAFGNGSGVVLNNAGTLRKSVAIGATTTSGFLVNNTGNIDVQTGTVDLGPATLSAGGTISGAGVYIVGGTVTVSGATTVIAGGTIRLTGIVSGTGTLTIDGTMDWQSGIIKGGGVITVTASGVLNITTNSNKSFQDRTLNLAGNGTWTGTGQLNGDSNAGVFNIQAGGVFNVETDAPFGNASGVALNNAGTLRKNTTTGITNSTGFILNNTGTVDVQTGTLSFSAGGLNSTGTFNAAAGATFAFGGGTHVLLGGSVSFIGAGMHSITAGSVETRNPCSVSSGTTFSVDGGTLTGVSNLTVNGTFGWTAGIITGGGAITIPTGGVLSVSGSSNKSFQDRTLNLSGNGTWMGTGNINGDSNAGVFNIQAGGLFDIQTDSDFGNASGVVFNNAGTLRKSAATGLTNNSGFAFSNSGTVDIQNGTLGFTYTQTAGTTNLNGGNLQGNLTLNGGTLTGAGTITGNVSNSATISPGGASMAGTINITGSYTQNSGGALNIELGGTAAGQFDVLAAGGGATLNGTLNVSLINSFNPTSGNSFNAVTFASRSGVFSTANTTGTNVNPVYGGTVVSLVFGAINPLVQITSPLNVSGVNGKPFTYTITANGQTPITFNATGAPAGLSFSVDTISGTPTATGTFAVTLTATNSLGSDARTLIINISATGSLPAITSSLNASGVAGIAFNYSISATGTQPISFNATGLPAGLSLNGNVIGGTPTAAGSSSVTLTASNTIGTDSKTLTIVIDTAVAPTITSSLTAGGTPGASFTYVITATGTQPLTLSASPLPAGLSFSGNTISGAPTATGTTTVTLSASNVVGSDSKNLVITIAAVAGAQPTILPDANPALVNKTVTFSATVSGTPTVLSWDFGDGSVAGTGNPVTHQFAAAGDFTVKLNVDSGTQTGSITLSVLDPNSGAAGVLNVSDGKPAVSNPDSGITSRIGASDGGVVEIDIDPTNLAARATFEQDFDITTNFNGLAGRVATRAGSKAVNKFTDSGIFVADTDATRKSTGDKGKARKMIVVSREETGQSFLAKPADSSIALTQIKGKFLFTKSTADQVSFSGTIKLPAGIDTLKEQTVSIGLGNVIDAAKFAAKGKGTLPSTLGRINKLSIKYPKLSTGTVTQGGETALVSFTLKLADMDVAGFDSEGISVRGTSGTRSIQVALVFAGVSYDAVLPVQYTLSSKGDAGAIAGRGAK